MQETETKIKKTILGDIKDPTYHQTVSQNVFEMPAEISRTELKGYEEITPPYIIRPKIVHLQYDSKQKYQFVIFDT